MSRFDTFVRLVVRLCDPRDWLLVVSLLALLYGVSQWSGPLAWVVGGACGVVLWSLPYWRRKVVP